VISSLAEDAVYRSDGGGRRPAARKRLAGAGRVARLLWGVARRNRWSGPRWAERLTINGLPGWLSVQPEGTLQTTALDIAGMRVTAIYVIRNPDKLRHLERRVPEAVRSVRGAQAPDAPAIAEGRGWR
jgi:RNA polymerase sigma-70 factor (ECF subfamily)